MSKPLRVGIGLAADDPFWIQVHGAIYQHGNKFPVKLIPLDRTGFFSEAANEEYNAVLDEIVSKELDVLLGWNFPDFLANLVLDMGLPIVHFYETKVKHPLVVSPIGLEKIAEELAHYVANLLQRRGNVLVIGGMLRADHPDDGRSRIAGIRRAFHHYPDVQFHHLQTDWLNNADVAIRSELADWTKPLDAIFGLSDSLALLGRQIALEIGCCDENIPVVGINGDPLALAAIIQGQMTATVETPAVNLAHRAFDIALRIASDQPYPPHYEFNPRLVTANNVTNVTAQKMANITEISNYIINYERGAQQDYEDTIKCSAEISRQVAAASDYERLPAELANLIRMSYGYDHAQLYYWSEREQSLTFAMPGREPGVVSKLLLSDAGVLSDALAKNKSIFIPDCRRSFRYRPDSANPDTRCRLILPIRHGGAILGLLDLHAFRVIQCTKQRLIGMQSLADQIGIPIYNARLNREALQAKAMAEKANQLKIRLLAGIRNQLRSSQSAAPDFGENPERANDAAASSKRKPKDTLHLLRLLDDLLETGRVEIVNLTIEDELAEPASDFSHAIDMMSEAGGNSFSTSSSQADTVVKDTITYIQQNFQDRVSRSELASAVGVSESYLTQIFRRVTGIALWDYLVRYRVYQAKVLLRQTNDSIGEISAQVGFDDPAYFSRVFRRYVGQSPRDFRNAFSTLRSEAT